MPQVVLTENFNNDITRLSAFLKNTSPASLPNMMRDVFASIKQLEEFPELGKQAENFEKYDFRELVIPFGKNNYLALYRYDKLNDLVYVVAIKHSRELQFSIQL